MLTVLIYIFLEFLFSCFRIVIVIFGGQCHHQEGNPRSARGDAVAFPHRL